MSLTKEQRLQVYKEMLEIAISDRIISMKINRDDDLLYGLCSYLRSALAKLKINDYYRIQDMPELIALKPKFKGYDTPLYWWSLKSTSMVRINKLKKVIAEMETNLNS